MIKGALRSNVLPMEIGCKRLLNTADQQNNIPGAHALVPSLCNTPYTVLSILTAHIFLQETDRTEVLIPLCSFAPLINLESVESFDTFILRRSLINDAAPLNEDPHLRKSHLHEIRDAECRCGLSLITSLRKVQTAVLDVSLRFSAVEAGCGGTVDRPDRSFLSCEFSGC